MIRLIHNIFCDHCPFWEFTIVAQEADKEKARRKAREKGWIRVEGKDYCPDCARGILKDRYYRRSF